MMRGMAPGTGWTDLHREPVAEVYLPIFAAAQELDLPLVHPQLGFIHGYLVSIAG